VLKTQVFKETVVECYICCWR